MSTLTRRARAVLVVAGTVLLLTLVLPSVAGARWGAVADTLTGVPPLWLAGLTAVWAGGLLLHSITLTAALPGLSHRRALTLSLTGSAVANVLPVGGAAGVLLNHRMVRGWGHDGDDFAAYTVVTNLWDVLAKLLVPLAAAPLLLLSHDPLLRRLAVPASVGAGVLALVVLVVGALIGSERLTALLGRRLDRAVAVAAGWVHREPGRWGSRLVAVRRGCADVVRAGWGRLSLGMVLYTAALVLLLWGCCTVVGAAVTVPALLAGFAVERLCTLAGLTPGGAGVVEVGLTSVLVAFGGLPVPVVAAVLLYRLFTFGLEIPVGAAGLLAWGVARRRAATRSARAGWAAAA